MKKTIFLVAFTLYFYSNTMEKPENQNTTLEPCYLLLLPSEILVEIFEYLLLPNAIEFSKIDILDAIKIIANAGKYNVNYLLTCKKFELLINIIKRLRVILDHQSELYKELLPKIYAPEYLNMSQKQKNDELIKLILDLQKEPFNQGMQRAAHIKQNFKAIRSGSFIMQLKPIEYKFSDEQQSMMAKLIISGAIYNSDNNNNDPIYAEGYFLNKPLLAIIAQMGKGERLIPLLVLFGADINQKFKHIYTPYRQAMSSENFNIAKLLIHYGAKRD